MINQSLETIPLNMIPRNCLPELKKSSFIVAIYSDFKTCLSSIWKNSVNINNEFLNMIIFERYIQWLI